MATRRVNFTVTSKAGVQAFWIAVSNTDVLLVDGKGSIDVETGRRTLTWWFAGNPGGKLSIVGKVGENSVVDVKESTIPPSEHEAAGRKRFDVK